MARFFLPACYVYNKYYVFIYGSTPINMKCKFLLSGFLILSIYSCKKSSPVLAGVPDCIIQKIESIQNEPVRNPPASIWQYEHKGKIVYYEPSYCCDMYSVLYDSDCNIICSPDGGIAGSGDGKCEDFFRERKNEKLIWKDQRQ